MESATGDRVSSSGVHDPSRKTRECDLRWILFQGSATPRSLTPQAAEAQGSGERSCVHRSTQDGDVAMIDALQFLRINDMCRLRRISKPTLWRLRQTHEFPEPTEVTDRLIAWRRSEVEAWLRTRHIAGQGASTRPPPIVLDDASDEATANTPLEETQQRPKSKTIARTRGTRAPTHDEQLTLLLKIPE